MADRPTSSRSSPAWAVLYVVPWLLYSVFLVPGLGEYGEGLWPEWFAPELVGTEMFGDFAIQVRQWSIGVLVLATAVAVAVYVWIVHAWSARLKTFDVARLTGYRSFVWSRVPVAFGGACAAALFAVFVSESLRAADVAGWVIFVAAAGVFAWLQFFAIVFARRQTRLLYRGR